MPARVVRRSIDAGVDWTACEALRNPDRDRFPWKIDEGELEPADLKNTGDHLLVGAGSDIHALSFASGQVRYICCAPPDFAVASPQPQSEPRRTSVGDHMLTSLPLIR